MNPQERKSLHIRIWGSGIIATILALIIFSLNFEGGNILSYTIQGFIFLSVWVILHYLFYRPLYIWLLKRQKNR